MAAPLKAEQIYDTIMAEIEPELTTAGIAEQSVKYAKQSREDLLERLDDYDQAFALFDLALSNIESECREQVRGYRDQRQQQIHEQEKVERSGEQANAEHMLDQFNPEP